MALAKDDARYGGRARAFDQGPATGDVVYASNFGQNFYDGWRPIHFGSFAPTQPVGLTAYPTHSGARALQLSTEMRTYAAGNAGVQCITARSLSHYCTARRYLSYSAFLTVGIGYFDLAYDIFGLSFDIQKANNSSRSLPNLIIKGALGSPNYSKAQIINDAGATVDIPGTTHLWPGDNENKQNFGYLRLTWDLQANSGLGGYKEAQIQDQVFNLTGLGAGSAAFTPQTDVISGQGSIAEFSSGVNLGLFVSRNTAQPNAFPATLVADSIIVTNHD